MPRSLHDMQDPRGWPCAESRTCAESVPSDVARAESEQQTLSSCDQLAVGQMSTPSARAGAATRWSTRSLLHGVARTDASEARAAPHRVGAGGGRAALARC